MKIPLHIMFRKLFFCYLQEGECPPGHYCPPGTAYRFSFPCSIGFYRNASSAISEMDCSVCIAGYYCNVKGLPLSKPCPVVSTTSAVINLQIIMKEGRQPIFVL